MLFSKIFKRKGDQDKIDEMSYCRVGISLAASWSWGVSMIATMAFMHTKGIIPALAWVTGNILAMPLFGYMRTKVPNIKKWINFLPFAIFVLIIVTMAIIMNQQALLIGLGGGEDIVSYHFLDNKYSIPLIIALSLAILVFIYKYGLRGSVLTDLGQYIAQIIAVGLLAVLSISISNFTINQNLELITADGINWVFPLGFLGILFGAFTDPMMLERFEHKKNSIKLGLLGGFWFGIYMLLVVITGLFFKPTLILGILLLFVIIAVATSTLDSAFSSIQYSTKRLGIGKTPGLILAFIAIITWPYLMGLGMSKIWSIYASYRWKIVVFMIIVSLLGIYIPKERYRNKIINFLQKYKLYIKEN